MTTDFTRGVEAARIHLGVSFPVDSRPRCGAGRDGDLVSHSVAEVTCPECMRIYGGAPATAAVGEVSEADVERYGRVFENAARCVGALGGSHRDGVAVLVTAVRAERGPADDPALDATDGAHPAWWRGHEHGAEAMRRGLARRLGAKDDTPWQVLLKRVRDIDDAERGPDVVHLGAAGKRVWVPVCNFDIGADPVASATSRKVAEVTCLTCLRDAVECDRAIIQARNEAAERGPDLAALREAVRAVIDNSMWRDIPARLRDAVEDAMEALDGTTPAEPVPANGRRWNRHDTRRGTKTEATLARRALTPQEPAEAGRCRACGGSGKLEVDGTPALESECEWCRGKGTTDEEGGRHG